MAKVKRIVSVCALAVLLLGVIALLRVTDGRRRDGADASGAGRAPSASVTGTARPRVVPRGTAGAGPRAGAMSGVERGAAAEASAPYAWPEDAIPGEYVFRFYDERDRALFEKLARGLGVRVMGSMAVGHAVRIRVDDPRLLRALLKQSPTPIDWMPNTYVRFPEREDNAPLAPVGGYRAFGSGALAWLGVADNAGWGSGVTVAILDNGVAAAASLRGVNITHLDLVNEPGHVAAHGTAVASLIAGRDGSVRGVSPDVDLLSIKVMSDAGSGNAFTLAQGIIEAVDRGANVINLSLGASSDSRVLREAVDYAVERGVLLVAAPGNDAVRGVFYPARYEAVIAVPGVDANGEWLYFSNRGAENDIAAPGAGVSASQPEGDPILFSGTSAAVPFVAGAVAALLSQDPSLSASEVVALLAGYSDDAGAPGADEAYGAGVLDVGRLMNRNTPGIYDMVAMVPYTRDDASGEGLDMDVSAQNRGTEVLAKVVMDVTWEGQSQTFTFYDVRVGDTVSQRFSFRHDALPAEGLDFRFAVSPVGVSDATPRNNSLRSRIGAEARP